MLEVPPCSEHPGKVMTLLWFESVVMFKSDGESVIWKRTEGSSDELLCLVYCAESIPAKAEKSSQLLSIESTKFDEVTTHLYHP